MYSVKCFQGIHSPLLVKDTSSSILHSMVLTAVATPSLGEGQVFPSSPTV